MISINKVVRDIKSIKIQGATNIAKASIGALLDFSKSFSGDKADRFIKEAEKIAKQLAWARPDEPLSQNLLNFIIIKLKKGRSKNIKEKISNFQKSCQDALDLIFKNERLITETGVALIRKLQTERSLAPKKKELSSPQKPLNIFTHCNSLSVAMILIGAHQAKIPLKIYNSETRPRFQGRVLAKHLTKAGISVIMMIDSAAPFVISKNDPDKIDVDLVIIGADVVGMDGSVLNKIGSYSLALAAKNAGVPFYAATSLLKARKDIGSYREIEIEKRDPTELWQKSLKGIKTINYAFDTVPPEYLKGLITEFGILKPEKVKKTAGKNYKEIFKNKQ